jgi:hypothetical protein
MLSRIRFRAVVVSWILGRSCSSFLSHPCRRAREALFSPDSLFPFRADLLAGYRRRHS